MSGAAARSFGTHYFPALQQRNFRVFWLGQCVSVIGTWMHNVGQAWLVLELTGSAAKLGLVSAIQSLPMMVLSLFAGPCIDRFPKRRTIILAGIAWLHLVQYWMILVLAFLIGLVQLVDNPTRQA